MTTSQCDYTIQLFEYGTYDIKDQTAGTHDHPQGREKKLLLR